MHAGTEVEANTSGPFRGEVQPEDEAAAKLELLSINTIRTLSMDAVQKAKSGHPGTPMALAPVAFVLWDRYLRHNPREPRTGRIATASSCPMATRPCCCIRSYT